MSTPSDITPEALLAHSDWIRHLVAGLVRDPGRTDDVLQETWLIALQRPPQEEGNLRGWLASVARSVIQNFGRCEGRRQYREQAVARLEALPDTVDVIAKARLQGRMVDAVLGLDEPYRSSVLLRFFEDLPPREIAERLGRPVNTVRTHIARGLAQLRTELDAEFGDRESWGMAFLPLLWGGKSQAAGGTALAKTGGSLLLLKWIAAALIALVSLLAWNQRQAPKNEQAPLQPMNDLIAGQDVSAIPVSDSVPDVLEHEQRLAIEQEVTPTKPKGAIAVEMHLIEGRCVDVTGQPLGGLSLTLRDLEALKVDNGWLGEVGKGLELTPELISQLEKGEFNYVDYPGGHLSQSDAQRLLAQLSYGTPKTITQRDGSFSIEVPFEKAEFACESGHLTIVGEGTHATESGVEERILVFSERATLRGQIVNGAGEPLEGVQVRWFRGVEYLPQLPFVLKPNPRGSGSDTAETDAGGNFRFKNRAYVPGVPIFTELTGYQRSTDSLPTQVPALLKITMRAESALLTINGMVIDSEGAHVANATVVFLHHEVKTDAHGLFRLEIKRKLRYLPDDHEILAYAANKAPAVIQNFSRKLKSDPHAGEDLILQLTGPTGSIRGRVQDPQGNPLRSKEVYLRGGTPVGRSSSRVEHKVGSQWSPIRTDAEGRFEIKGLFNDSYGLDVVERGTFLASSVRNIPLGTDDLVITLDPTTRIPTLRGRVVDDLGIGVSGVQLSSTFTTFAHKSMRSSALHDLGLTDAEGYFELTDVPTVAVGLQVDSTHIERTEIELADWRTNAKEGELLNMVVLPRLHFQVSQDAVRGASRISLVDRTGEQIHYTTRSPGLTSGRIGDFPIPKNRPLPTFIVGAKAVELILYADNTILRRIPLHLKRGEITQIH